MHTRALTTKDGAGTEGTDMQRKLRVLIDGTEIFRTVSKTEGKRVFLQACTADHSTTVALNAGNGSTLEARFGDATTKEAGR